MPDEAPRLRAVDAVFVEDPARGRLLVLRDTEAIAPASVALAADLAAVVGRLDGRRSPARIAAEASRAGRAVDEAFVRTLVDELDRALLLDTPRFHAKRREAVDAFRSALVRPATHAGGAYHADAASLVRYIEGDCLAHAPARARSASRSLVGLCAPHMDLWRAAEGYGHAYGALRDGLGPEVDTVVLLGTSHAAMERPFAVCAKAFETPLGPLEPDREAILALARASRFDVHADEYLHKGEHSIELQAVFLRHALGARAGGVRIVPVLCGLGEAQARRRDPASLADAESFVAALAALVEERGPRALVIAGADLAHVGPRFGDDGPLDAAGRARLRARDRDSIALATARDAPAFFAHVAADLETRRVCGLGPLYTMLRVLGRGEGEVLHYAQHVDGADRSIVSHAALAFHA